MVATHRSKITTEAFHKHFLEPYHDVIFYK